MEAVERRVIVTDTIVLQCPQNKIRSFGRLPMRGAANAQFLIKAAETLEQPATMEGDPFGLSDPDGPAGNVVCARREASIDCATRFVREPPADELGPTRIQYLKTPAQEPRRVPAVIVRKDNDVSARPTPTVVPSGTDAGPSTRRDPANVEFGLIAFQYRYDPVVAVLVNDEDLEILELLTEKAVHKSCQFLSAVHS